MQPQWVSPGILNVGYTSSMPLHVYYDSRYLSFPTLCVSRRREPHLMPISCHLLYFSCHAKAFPFLISTPHLPAKPTFSQHSTSQPTHPPSSSETFSPSPQHAPHPHPSAPSQTQHRPRPAYLPSICRPSCRLVFVAGRGRGRGRRRSSVRRGATGGPLGIAVPRGRGVSWGYMRCWTGYGAGRGCGAGARLSIGNILRQHW
jgi:hypothetical protein